MRLPVLLAALTILLAGCSGAPDATPAGTSSPSTPTDGGGSPPRANVVHSVQEGDGNFFDPVELTIKVGETVTWDVVGPGHHTVDFLVPIDAAGTTPKSGDFGPGQTFEASFPEAGSYRYYCKYHSNKQTGMLGVIVVE